MAAAVPCAGGGGYDREAEVRAFDETKAGVKGLLDAGVTRVPRIFIAPSPPSEESHTAAAAAPQSHPEVPVIDLGRVVGRREEVVEEVRRASAEWGFFQVVGHGVPTATMEEMVAGVRRFHEMDAEAKKGFYSRDPARKVRFNSNFDLYRSPAANWRDTLGCVMAPDPPDPDEIPATCRTTIMEYLRYASKLGETLFELLSEALGLKPNHLREMERHVGQVLLGHYYPACPEPHLTFGTSGHSDPDFFSVLLQDQIGGLQVLHQDRWVDVSPIPGALVVNVGDLLQMISNDRFVSVEHRVLANRVGPRISVAIFFGPHVGQPSTTRLYGPIEELVSEESPPRYRKTLGRDYLSHYYSRGLDGKSSLSNFRL